MEYPEGLIAEKVAYLTRLLENEFGDKHAQPSRRPVGL